MNLHVLTNPGTPPKRRKSKGKGKKKVAKKRKGSKKRRRSAVKSVAAKIGRRVRRTVCKTKKRRKRNPGRISLRGLGGGMPSGKTIAGVALGALLLSASTKALAQGAPLFAGSGPSSLFGEPWNAKQYMAAAGVALIGPRVAEKLVRGSGQAVGLTALAVIVGKTIMPMLGKVPALQKFLGEAGDDGDITVDEDGQTWMKQGGRWVALQGLVETSALDALDESNAMDGLVDVSPMDAVDDDYGSSTSLITVN